MTNQKIIECFYQILREIEDIADPVFIIMFIFHGCENLSINDNDKMQEIAEKIGDKTNFTKSDDHFDALQDAFLQELRIHITPRQNQEMSNILRRFC